MCYRSSSILIVNFGGYSPALFSGNKIIPTTLWILWRLTRAGLPSTPLPRAVTCSPIHRVTVGLGVLPTSFDSSAKDLWITGTISTSPGGSESLEVVFALIPVCWVLGACGTLELICCGFWDIDEEETPINRVAEEAIWETSWPVSSAFVPATDKDLFAHYPQDQNS